MSKISILHNKKIAIIGAGISGLVTAISLAQKEIPTTIFEKNNINHTDFTTKDIRTIALNNSSRRFFKQINIWNDIKKKSAFISDIYVVNNKSDNMIHFNNDVIDKEKNDDDFLGRVIKHQDLKEILFSHIKKYQSFIQIKDNCSYSKVEIDENDKNIIYFDKQTNNNPTPSQTSSTKKIYKNNSHFEIFDLIFLADGHNSVAKSYFFSNKIEKDYSQKAISFLIKHPKKHNNTAVEHFSTNGVFANLPTSNQYESSIIWSIDKQKADIFLQMNKEDFTLFVQDHLGYSFGDITICSEILSFPLSAKLANKYFYKNIILIGDSAHNIHPLAGQGFNLIIKDIEHLINQLTSNDKADDINIILKNYQQTRSNDNLAMYQITDKLNYVFSHKSSLLNHLINKSFNIIDNNNFIKKSFIQYAKGIND